MALIYKQIEEKGQTFLEVCGADTELSFLHVPEEKDGIMVRSIGPHAFEDRDDITEVSLPENLRRLSAFSFHNCRNLQKFSLYDMVTDYHDGVIRGCERIREVRMHVRGENAANFEVLKRMLSDTDRVLFFHLFFPDGEARLSFPDYVNQVQEDPRARAIHSSIDGAGYTYRECVKRKGIDFTEYDRVFHRLIYDDPETALDIAFDRLMYPYHVTDAGKERYRAFLKEHADKALQKIILEKAPDRASCLTREKLIPEAAIDQALRLCADKGAAEIAAILMEYQREKRDDNQHGSRMEQFSLDD